MFFRSVILIVLFMIFFCSTGFAGEYESLGRRDPFVPLVGISDSGHRGIGGILTIEDVMLQGFTIGPRGTRNVVINGEVMKEGDKIGQLSVESIGDNVVKIKLDEEYHELKLYEE